MEGSKQIGQTQRNLNQVKFIWFYCDLAVKGKKTKSRKSRLKLQGRDGHTDTHTDTDTQTHTHTHTMSILLRLGCYIKVESYMDNVNDI